MLRYNRDAVIAIQGGGVYGLTLLGQLEAVLEGHGYKPLALAGSSAGAVIATLLWAGYRPSQIRAEFIRIAEAEEQGLVSLLGPFDPSGASAFGLSDILGLKDRCAELATSLGRGGISGLKSLWHLRSLLTQVGPYLARRGFFRGEWLEQHVERLLRHAPGVPPGLTPLEEPLRFRHFADLARRDREQGYRPPLLLTATNLTKSRLEVFSSVDHRYSNVPIAKAVRASAGFPLLLTPRDLPEAYDGGWFVDGGVVSNFPVWTFSDAFRQQLGRLPMYREIASLPWIRMGLRVVDDRSAAPDLTEPTRFFGSLLKMITGTARNELEEILSSRAARSIVIRQPLSETGLTGFLDLNGLDGRKVDALVQRGYGYADEHLKRNGSPGIFSSRLNAQQVRIELQALVERCIRVMGMSEADLKFRSNIFIPVEDRMKLTFSYNMDADADRDMEFQDLQSGLTGFCYTSRRPQLCNLLEITKVRRSGRPEYENLFGMGRPLQDSVRDDRSWLASVPIFDPYEVTLSPALQRPAGQQVYEGKAYRGLETTMDGPLLGVLNLDAGWDYAAANLDVDPDIHFADARVQTILSLMQTTASSVGRLLIELFPAQGGENA